MDENMRCKNCKYILEDREDHTFCCTNEKWNNNFAAKYQETEPEDFCSKFEEKIEKLSEIEVEILKLAKKLGCNCIDKINGNIYFSVEFGKLLNEILKISPQTNIFGDLVEDRVYYIDKLLENNENG